MEWVTGGQVMRAKPKYARPAGDLAALVERVAREEGIHPDFLHRVMKIESGGRTTAYSSTGARGLMQLLPGAMRHVFTEHPRGVRWANGQMADPEHPEENLRVGARYLKISAEAIRFDIKDRRHWPGIFVAYNLGAGNARRVLSGRPEQAASAISKQSFGGPTEYYVNVQKAFS